MEEQPYKKLDPKPLRLIRQLSPPWYQRTFYAVKVAITQWWDQQPVVVLHRVWKQLKAEQRRWQQHPSDPLGLTAQTIAKLSKKNKKVCDPGPAD